MLTMSDVYVVADSALPPSACVIRDHIALGGWRAAVAAPSSNPSNLNAASRSSSASLCIRSMSVSYMVSSESRESSVSRATSAVRPPWTGSSHSISSLSTSSKTQASRQLRSTATKHLASARLSSASASA